VSKESVSIEQVARPREVDSRGYCSKCGGIHFGSYFCPMSDEQIKEIKMPEADMEDLRRFVEAKDGGSAATEMPRYKCHKVVHALKIAKVLDPTLPGNESDGSRVIVPDEAGYAPFAVERDYVRKHNPQPGGYFVVYEDGYKSFSPAQAFESGYTRISA
jgi:hypothetical protein